MPTSRVLACFARVSKTNFLYFALFALFVSLSRAQSCTPPPDLVQQRLNASYWWTIRTNNNGQFFQQIADELMTEDHASIIAQTGKFSPKAVAIEYSKFAFGGIPGVPASVFLNMQYDPLSVAWLGTDVLTQNFTVNITILQNGVSHLYQGNRFTSVLTFEPCTKRIKVSWTNQDPMATLAFSTTARSVPVATVCYLIQLACPVNTTFQKYGSIVECIGYLSSKKSICPFPFISDNPICYLLHAANALIDPVTHCPHVSRQSMTCMDTCLSTCSSCDVNADCVPYFPGTQDLEYTCKCKPGFVGDGHTCTPSLCPAGQWQCPGREPFMACNNGSCGCQNTGFVWDSSSTNDACECPAGSYLNWYQGTPECIPVGRCRDRYQCPGRYSYGTCVQYGINPYMAYNTCQCNPGFQGGFEVPCQCSGQVVWSSLLGGDVCLQPGQCVANYSCPKGQSCTGLSSSSVIGICA